MAWKNWGDHPAVVTVGVLAGLAGLITLGFTIFPGSSPTTAQVSQSANGTGIQQTNGHNNDSSITTQNVTQELGDNNDCPIQLSGSNNNSVNCSGDNIDKIEKQENREVQAEQYNENDGSNYRNCSRSDGSCGDSGTININPEK
jgi:hypothetical protein